MSIRSVRVDPTLIAGRSAPPPARALEGHYRASLALTRFLKNRGLTFQKTGPDGVPRTFTVPVTSTVVRLPKSRFDAVERAARMLVVSLRHVLRDLYGSRSLEESSFAAFLPSDAREVFLRATLESPHYFRQLHHPDMRKYPFMDTVGLDLVRVDLVKSDLMRSDEAAGKNRERHGSSAAPGALPFRLLELNAGSPSGASNLASLMEGMLRHDPASLESLGRVLPNDHFRILRETYRSLGESWTGRGDGIAVLLPPGGGNGAAPEIHRLAAGSGLVYCDSGHLFCGEDGWIRMRTVCGKNPVVTAIHSRVNSDSALFDPAEGLLLRDPESGEPLYCIDALKPWKSGTPELLRDAAGKPVPLESGFAIPGALRAIRERRLYLGGLNRLIDNKILLPLLARFAIPFAREVLIREGLDPEGPQLLPPADLPPKKESLEVIARNPGDWVIKSPNLSGGKGVHILVSLDRRSRARILSEARRHPEQFAFQRRIPMGRIPVVVRGRRTGRLRISERAADLRMWMFFGADGTPPQLTRNALVRVAPGARGIPGALVNTSQGGGYAPFAVIDDLDSPDALPALEAARPQEPAPLEGGLPAFACAQLIQLASQVRELRSLVRDPCAAAGSLHTLATALDLQLREVASFLHPACPEALSKISAILEREREPDLADRCLRHEHDLAELTGLLEKLDPVLGEEFFDLLDGLRILDPSVYRHGYPAPARRADEVALGPLNIAILKSMMSHPSRRKSLKRLSRLLGGMIGRAGPSRALPARARSRIESLLDWFCEQADRRLRDSQESGGVGGGFGVFFRSARPVRREDLSERTATGWERSHQKRLVDSDWIEPSIARIREQWLRRVAGAEEIERERERHFREHPELARLQSLIDRTGNNATGPLLELMSVLPYAAYNLSRFAQDQGVPLESLFRTELVPDRIAILSNAAQERPWIRTGTSPGECYAGECFARKRSRHGLLSESDAFLWIAREQSPLQQLFTIGHELVHLDQLRALLAREREAIREGGLAFAAFLNDYCNVLVEAVNAREEGGTAAAGLRRPLYGLPDRMVSQFFSPVIAGIRAGLEASDEAYHRVLDRYGGLLGFMMPVSQALREKALREVDPALENAKNLVFAKECGLRIPVDEVQSVLPAANRVQCERYRARILRAVRGWELDEQTRRVIASHQFHGVRLRPGAGGWERLEPLRPGRGYHRTIQQ